MSIRTGITKVDSDEIIVRGRRLSEEIVGEIRFTDFFFLHCRGRMPSASESRLFDALLANSMDHGINHPVLVARLTYGAAPEAIQGAIAAGILGVGRVADGAIENVADALYAIANGIDGGLDEKSAIEKVTQRFKESGHPFPGLGHPLHKTADPRVSRLFALAEECGCSLRYINLLRSVAAGISEQKGRDVPVNGAGAVGAVYCELGFPAPIAKAATIVALSAGVVGHLMEEIHHPTARQIRKVVSEAVVFDETLSKPD